MGGLCPAAPCPPARGYRLGASPVAPALRRSVRAGLGWAGRSSHALGSSGKLWERAAKMACSNTGLFILPVIAHFLQRFSPLSRGPWPCVLTVIGGRSRSRRASQLALTFTVRAGETKGVTGELLGAFSARGKATLCVYATHNTRVFVCVSLSGD